MTSRKRSWLRAHDSIVNTTSARSPSESPADVTDGHVEFTIESWARSHDRFLDVLYDKLGIAKALQGEMWSIACDRFAQLVEGEHVGPLDVVTERAS